MGRRLDAVAVFGEVLRLCNDVGHVFEGEAWLGVGAGRHALTLGFMSTSLQEQIANLSKSGTDRD